MLSLNKISSKLSSKSNKHGELISQRSKPLIIPRTNHNISRSQLSSATLNVLYGLKNAGYASYLVGGCVRDLLLGRQPKDFDVATNASPEQIHKLFRRSRLIGRRFKLVHVGFGHEVTEVATFRAPPEIEQHVDDQGRIVRDNVYGSLEQDAWRRDFTMNALYYNIEDCSIVDYTGGISDLQNGKICLIGDVETRYREDPVRILRAIRFVGKLGLVLDYTTELWIPRLAELLTDISPARLFDETLKLYLSGNAVVNNELLGRYGVFKHLFPQTGELLDKERDDYPHILLTQALENTDKRIDDSKPVTPAFLFAALLWEPVRHRWHDYIDNNNRPSIPIIPAMQQAASEVISKQIQRVAVPKRYTLVTRDIWMLQPRLTQRLGKRAFRVLAQPKFRAGYDFLLLRNAAGERLDELADWWTLFQEQNKSEQQKMIKCLSTSAGSIHDMLSFHKKIKDKE